MYSSYQMEGGRVSSWGEELAAEQRNSGGYGYLASHSAAGDESEAHQYCAAAYQQSHQPHYMPPTAPTTTYAPYIPSIYPLPQTPPFPSPYSLFSHDFGCPDPSASQQSWTAQDRQFLDQQIYYKNATSTLATQGSATFGAGPSTPVDPVPAGSALTTAEQPQLYLRQDFAHQHPSNHYPPTFMSCIHPPQLPLSSPTFDTPSAFKFHSAQFDDPSIQDARQPELPQPSAHRRLNPLCAHLPVTAPPLPATTKRDSAAAAATLAHVASLRRGQLGPGIPNQPSTTASDSTSCLGSLAGRGGRGGGTKKLHRELMAACWICGEEKARLVLRGPDVEQMVPRCHLRCLKCAQVDPIEERGGVTRSSKQAAQDEWTYQDTLSAAVDLLEGVKLEDQGRQHEAWHLDELPTSVKAEAMICDVCNFSLGLGSVKASTPAGSAKFSVEVVCSLCDSLYRPCSDCGGGGGRLTPGRWRCKELFAANRKTCMLPHSRTPALSELSFEFFNIIDVPTSRVDEIEQTCGSLFWSARMGAIARPEHLAHSDGLASSFAQLERSTIDSWNLVAPLLREDIEASRGIRRFVALEYAVPRARQKGKAEGKPEPYGFYIVRTAGSSFDSHWHFGAFVMKQIEASLAETNATRALQNLSPYPPITANFLLSGFKSDSRLNGSLLRRGYKPLSEYVKEYPDLPAFHRPLHIPAPYAHVWQVWVFAVQQGAEFARPRDLTFRRRKRVVGVKSERSKEGEKDREQ